MTAKQFFEEELSGEPLTQDSVIEALIQFTELHLKKVQELQRAKYYCGETGYLTEHDWREIINEIK